ncbi:Ig-like domain-containing protein [bacterium]|nr:Ig-like domain-containing protein [bacterium]
MVRTSLYIVLISLLPVMAWSVTFQPESGATEGVVKAGDAVVLQFDRPVVVDGVSATVAVETADGQAVPVSVTASGINLVLRPVSAWPKNSRLTVTLDTAFRLQGRPYSGPSTLTLFVQGDEWDQIEQAMQKAPTRETKADGYLENGVEVYPLPFTPNGDGYNDELHVARPGQGFLKPLVRIFGLDGIRVMSLGKRSLRNGEVIWDGVDRLGHEVRPGPYFIIVEEDMEILASGVIYVLR